MKTNHYLDEVKLRHDLASDYALAKLLNVSPSRIGNYRGSRAIMDNTICVKVAELLAKNPMEVIAAAELERAKRDDVKKVWLRYAAALILAVSAGAPQDGAARSLHNPNSTTNTHSNTTEYTFQHTRRKRRSSNSPGRTRRAPVGRSRNVNPTPATRKKTARKPVLTRFGG